MFIIQNNQNPYVIKPYYHQDMFVQYDPTIRNPITLPVTTSSEPDGGFVINNARELDGGFVINNVRELDEGFVINNVCGVTDKKAKRCCILL